MVVVVVVNISEHFRCRTSLSSEDDAPWPILATQGSTRERHHSDREEDEEALAEKLPDSLVTLW